ncbi:hypothetical protein AXF42_Ash011664 [Apostasia shenzhenica]|uniref:HIT-type domain-containing protein n=1 Tax=Apostasia shenzhenica TaxID=1088818 RepID=A0A2H9ZUN2_9ASPA|nr:hypothetical protein AXF42_Ash011664 [Apostasia shenzhenica]
MAEEGASRQAYPMHNSPTLCEECGLNPWKYRCPGCSIRSCCLACVNSHKKRTDCTGKRNRTEFVPFSSFNDDLLLSDYNMLEETKRISESAKRMLSGFRGYHRFKLPIQLQALRRAAKRRRIRLLYLPCGMSKREANQSRYDGRKESISWTIDFRFHGTNIVLVDHGIYIITTAVKKPSNQYMFCMPQKHLAPGPWIHQLKPFCDAKLEDLKLFLRINPKGSKSLFRKLNVTSSIGSQLKNIVILEYPVIYVYLHSHHCDFEVEYVPFSKNEVSSGSDLKPCVKDSLYTEEEIKEADNPSATLVTDLMHRTNPAANCLDVHKGVNNALNAQVAKNTAGAGTTSEFVDTQMPEDNIKGHGISNVEDCRSIGPNSPEFCFEQELTGAYLNLICEINPDDFLSIDDDEIACSVNRRDVSEKCMGSSGLEEKTTDIVRERRSKDPEQSKENPIFSNGYSLGEVELEEGEIPCP